MQSQQTKVLKLGRSYDAGVLFGDSRLLGFEFAAMETTMHGVRLNLVASPPWAQTIESDSGQVSSTEE